MKNLATCKPSEFIQQTTKIKKAVEHWLTATDILNIRKRIPDIIQLTEDMSEEDKLKAAKKNMESRRAQARENLSDMFNAIFSEHPKETLELLGMLCFVEPEDIDNHPISEYLGSVYESLSDENVIRFFSLFRKWGLLDT